MGDPEVIAPGDSNPSPPKEESTGTPCRGPGIKSQVSFSAAALSRSQSMTTQQFLEYRQGSGNFAFIPSNFFQSRAEIRTWGAEDLTDPSIQPYDKDSPDLPRPFHVSLPGYAPRLCKFVISKGLRKTRDPLLGPEITIFPPSWVPQWTPDPNFKAQKYGYNWEDNQSYKMDRLPYVNAEFNPISAEVTNMYEQNYPYTAYPYGVPRIE